MARNEIGREQIYDAMFSWRAASNWLDKHPDHGKKSQPQTLSVPNVESELQREYRQLYAVADGLIDEYGLETTQEHFRSPAGLLIPGHSEALVVRYTLPQPVTLFDQEGLLYLSQYFRFLDQGFLRDGVEMCFGKKPQRTLTMRELAYKLPPVYRILPNIAVNNQLKEVLPKDRQEISSALNQLEQILGAK